MGLHAITETAETENNFKSLAPHEVFVIWNGDATEILSFHLSEKEMRYELNSLVQNADDDETYHLTTYSLKTSIETEPNFSDDEDDDEDED